MKVYCKDCMYFMGRAFGGDPSCLSKDKVYYDSWFSPHNIMTIQEKNRNNDCKFYKDKTNAINKDGII